MNWNKWVRRFHRWISLAFTLAVIVVTVAVIGAQEPAEWLFLLPVPPLILLLLSGLYLFVLPHATRWRGGQRAAGAN